MRPFHPMRTPARVNQAGWTARAAILVVAVALFAGCAIGPSPGGPVPSQPIARISLRPEFRVFHDALVDYGDWVLIEPAGFVFRPKVNFESWRPYNDGFWVPTDFYGWVWVSTEPFGWATYHYGNWFYDVYQGWVWAPGVDWGPSWVSWSTSGVYAGWTPLGPSGIPNAQIPANATTWVQASSLGQPDLKNAVQAVKALSVDVAAARPANNPVTIEGVRVNTGPSFDWVERQGAGPLQIAKLQDLVTPNAPIVPGDRTLGDTPLRSDRSGVIAPDPNARIPMAIEAQRAAERATRDARLAQKGGPVVQLPVVRPFGVPTTRGAIAPVRSESDTLR